MYATFAKQTPVGWTTFELENFPSGRSANFRVGVVPKT